MFYCLKVVQILHVNGNHWLTISTMDPGFDMTVYDSLHFTLHESTKSLLAQLLQITNKHISVKFASTNKQAEFDDCGVFSAAYCTALVHGEYPNPHMYNQKGLQSHLIKCIESGVVQPFPMIRQRRIGTPSTFTVEVYMYTAIVGIEMMEARWCSVISVKTGIMLTVLKQQW